jgi:hypothetical protein
MVAAAYFTVAIHAAFAFSRVAAIAVTAFFVGITGLSCSVAAALLRIGIVAFFIVTANATATDLSGGTPSPTFASTATTAIPYAGAHISRIAAICQGGQTRTVATVGIIWAVH